MFPLYLQPGRFIRIDSLDESRYKLASYHTDISLIDNSTEPIFTVPYYDVFGLGKLYIKEDFIYKEHEHNISQSQSM